MTALAAAFMSSRALLSFGFSNAYLLANLEPSSLDLELLKLEQLALTW